MTCEAWLAGAKPEEAWLAELEERGLLEAARNVARAHGLRTLELYVRDAGKARREARAAFYGLLRVTFGWSNVEIAHLMGRSTDTVREALKRYPPAIPQPDAEAAQ